MARKFSPWKRCCTTSQASHGIEAVEVAPTDLDTAASAPLSDFSQHLWSIWARRAQRRGDALSAMIAGRGIQISRRCGGGLYNGWQNECIRWVQFW